MKKARIASILLLGVLLVSLLPAPMATADDVVIFPDPNLEAAIRAAIAEPTGNIYESDLVGLTSLHASERGITDLTGLEHCTSLTWLWLNGNQISDKEPLVDNPGISLGDEVDLSANRLSCTSVYTYIPQLEARGVMVQYSWQRLEGDVNYDGSISSADLQLVAQHIVRTLTLTGDEFLSADVNDSGKLDSADLQLVTQYLIGTITAFLTGTYIP